VLGRVNNGNICTKSAYRDFTEDRWIWETSENENHPEGHRYCEESICSVFTMPNVGVMPPLLGA